MDENATWAGAPPPPEHEDDTAEAARIRAEIAQTRENIGSTIEALQQKLSPDVLAEQATTAVRDATIGKVENMVQEAQRSITRTGHSMYDTMRANPLPAALAAFGMGWLYLSYRKSARYEREMDVQQGYPGSYRRELGESGSASDRPMQRVEEAAEGAGHAVTEAARDAGHALSETARSAGHTLAGAAQGAGHAVSEAAQGAGRAVKHAAQSAGEQGRRLENRLENAYYDNPLAAGAIVLAAGTTIGLAIPISRKEDQWMGSLRDDVVEKAADLAHQALGKVEGAAKKVENAAGSVERALSPATR